MQQPQDFSTADLWDAHIDGQAESHGSETRGSDTRVRVADPIFRWYGGRQRWSGAVRPVWAPEDNSLVRAALETPGEGQVLVVDGGGSLHCALIGDKLAELAIQNDWAGLWVHGCIRDTEVINQMPIGVLALASTPRRSIKAGRGRSECGLFFAGVNLEPGSFVYGDSDGVLVSNRPLLPLG